MCIRWAVEGAWEVITMCVFFFFATLYMKEKLTLDYLWASLCLVAAAYFMFRPHGHQI